MSDNKKFEKIIPVGRQRFAYQCENIGLVMKMVGNIPYRGSGSEPYPNEEKALLREYGQYEFSVHKHTANSMIVELRKYYKDGKIELYWATMTFSDFVNQVFCKVECSVMVEKESDDVKKK